MEVINITCPHCGFSKTMKKQKVPEGKIKTTCPNCQNSFVLGENQMGEQNPAPPLQSGPAASEGEEITEFEHKICSTCGKKIHVKAEICPKCGVRVSPPPSGLNKVALLLITFCFGGLGAHKFYQKNMGSGSFTCCFSGPTFLPLLLLSNLLFTPVKAKPSCSVNTQTLVGQGSCWPLCFPFSWPL